MTAATAGVNIWKVFEEGPDVSIFYERLLKDVRVPSIVVPRPERSDLVNPEHLRYVAVHGAARRRIVRGRGYRPGLRPWKNLRVGLGL